MTNPEARGVSAKVRARVARGGVRAWSTADFPDFPASTVTTALNRLASKGEVLPVRKGVYWKGRKRPWGMSRPDNLELARAITHTDGIGWAGLSAANTLGLTTQVPAVEEIAVPVPAPRSPVGVKFVARPTRAGRSRIRLSANDVALLEVLNDWNRVIEVTPQQAVETLADALKSGMVDGSKVARAAVGEAGPVRDRLRVVLQSAGMSELATTIPPSPHPSTTRNALTGIAS